MARVASKNTKPKIRVTAAHIAAHRDHHKKDHSPKWDRHEDMNTEEFAKYYRDAIQYYNLEFSSKDLKPAVLTWMANNGYDKAAIDLFKRTKDWRCSIVMGAIASCLNRGMPAVRVEFNNGKSFVEWLHSKIKTTLQEGAKDVAPVNEAAPGTPTVSVLERTQDTSAKMTEEFDYAIDEFLTNPTEYEFTIKPLNYLKGKNCKAAHAKFIKEQYSYPSTEIQQIISKQADDQLVEAYSFLNKKTIKKLAEFYKDIESACDMIVEEGKATRKPRVKKAVSKDKLVEKLKYKKIDDQYKLVSINPTDIIGAKELWCYNTKTRKLGKYVASEFSELSVKGTSIVGFDETLSMQKTLRKPLDQLKEFKSAGKVALRKFLTEINAVETVLTGRINEDIIILKAA